MDLSITPIEFGFSESQALQHQAIKLSIVTHKKRNGPEFSGPVDRSVVQRLEYAVHFLRNVDVEQI